ncbi:hypothetical protein L3Q82_001967 [Scortum barcoo]|uniref:Uncharacterized protein n=1 Tax=Scortum barcoo TaxID=214431 RepID=A0ACB8W2A8_9TELE|nr:hypothetical protein L3Q82_001967 [Scortum barcoo]
MISAVLSSVLAGLLALLLYQRTARPFFWMDLCYYLRLRRYGKALKARMQRGIITYLDCFLHQARKSPDRAFIMFGEQTLTYRDVDRRSNRFANAFRAEVRLKQGHVVALLMFNEPDFICAWLALCKVGCEAAFLNTNMKARALLRCLHSCGARTLLVGSDLVCLVEEVLPDLKRDNIAVWVVDHTSPSKDFNSLLDKVERMSGETLSDLPKVDIMSNFVFIFTSGTTGLSKAARVGHLKAIMSMAFFHMCGATSDDIIYITLPLYHMSASLLGIGGCIYLEEKAHSVRLAAGSGLRSDVWKEFVKRFGKIKIREGYGLTEASIGFLNYTDEVGPIGRASYFNKLSMPFELLRYDPQTYEPVRTGLWKMHTSTKRRGRDLGSSSDCYEPVPGLCWKQGYEGRAGMAAVVLKRDHKLNGTKLYNHLVKTLPAYAWPWFLRVQTSLDVTETFKQQKVKLVHEGFNPDVTQDPLYFLDVSQKDYILLTAFLYEDIVSGKIKL